MGPNSTKRRTKSIAIEGMGSFGVRRGFHTTQPAHGSFIQSKEWARTGQPTLCLRKTFNDTGYLLQRSKSSPETHVSLHAILAETAKGVSLSRCHTRRRHQIQVTYGRQYQHTCRVLEFSLASNSELQHWILTAYRWIKISHNIYNITIGGGMDSNGTWFMPCDLAEERTPWFFDNRCTIQAASKSDSEDVEIK